MKINNQAEYDAMLAFLNGAPSGSEFFHPTLRLYVRNSPYIQNNINEFVEIMRHDGWCGNSVSSDFFDELLCLKDIERGLLEYRRKNNIYEVGDPVIRKWNNQLYWIISNIDNGSEFLIHKNKGARFKDCKVCELPCNLSHANDAEIEANRRLDCEAKEVL